MAARLGDLLAEVRARFPAALVWTFGYHYTFSHQSFRSVLDDVRLAHTLIRRYYTSDNQFDEDRLRGARDGAWFLSITAAAVARTAARFAMRDRGPGAVFVPVLHGPQHAAFAPAARSWGVRGPA